MPCSPLALRVLLRDISFIDSDMPNYCVNSSLTKICRNRRSNVELCVGFLGAGFEALIDLVQY